MLTIAWSGLRKRVLALIGAWLATLIVICRWSCCWVCEGLFLYLLFPRLQLWRTWLTSFDISKLHAHCGTLVFGKYPLLIVTKMNVHCSHSAVVGAVSSLFHFTFLNEVLSVWLVLFWKVSCSLSLLLCSTCLSNRLVMTMMWRSSAYITTWRMWKTTLVACWAMFCHWLLQYLWLKRPWVLLMIHLS